MKSRKNEGLRVVVMSATLDSKIFSEYLGQCGLLEMRGRQFEVELMYSSHEVGRQQQVEESVKAVIRMHLHEPAGDILVFLNGQAQCEHAVTLTYQNLQLLMD